MDVRMPDGTVIQNVPDGITQSELLSRYQKFSKSNSNFDIRNVNVQDHVAQQAGEPLPDRPAVQDDSFKYSPGQALKDASGLTNSFLSGKEGITPQDKATLLATVASMAAPELAIPARAVQAMGPYISQVASQALKIPAAFLGGSTGRAVGEIQSDPKAEVSDILLKSLKSGGEMAAAETTGAMVGPLVSKIFAPGAASLTDDAKGLMQFAKEKNIPATPSSFSPNITAKGVEGGTDAFFPSRLVNDHYRKKAVTRFNQLMTEIPEEVGKIEGNNVINPKALKEVGEFLKASKATGKDLSNEFVEAVGTKKVNVSNTLDTFNRIKRTATDESLLNWINTKSSQLKAGKIPGDELEEALRQVGGIKPKTDKKWLDEIRNAIKSDFESAGAPMEKLAESNKAFGENYALTGKKFVRELSDNAALGGDGTALTVKMFRNGNESFLNSLAKESEKQGGKISKETWDSLRAQNLQNMIINSSVENKRVMGLRTLDGHKLEKILDANKSAIQTAYKDKPQTIQAMYNMARLAKSTSGDMKEFEKGMSDILKQGNVAAGVTSVATDPTVLLIGTSTAPFIAKSLMNPNGWAKQWLTTGFDPKIANEGLKIGGRAVFSGALDGED